MAYAPPPPRPPEPDLSRPCVTCHHSRRTLGWWLGIPSSLMCAHPGLRWVKRDAVAGTIEAQMQTCDSLRRHLGRCGPRGIHWQAKPQAKT